MIILKQINLNSKGMSLLDVIMALSILGIVALGIMHLAKSTTDVQTRNYISVDYAGLADELYFYLGQKKHCSKSLEGITIDDNNADFINAGSDPAKGLDIDLKIDNATPAGKVKINQGTRYGKLNIIGVKFSMPDLLLGQLPASSAPNFESHQALITIYTQAIIGSKVDAGGNSVADVYTPPPLKKNVIVEYDSSNTITRCLNLDELGLSP